MWSIRSSSAALVSVVLPLFASCQSMPPRQPQGVTPSEVERVLPNFDDAVLAYMSDLWASTRVEFKTDRAVVVATLMLEREYQHLFSILVWRRALPDKRVTVCAPESYHEWVGADSGQYRLILWVRSASSSDVKQYFVIPGDVGDRVRLESDGLRARVSVIEEPPDRIVSVLDPVWEGEYLVSLPQDEGLLVLSVEIAGDPVRLEWDLPLERVPLPMEIREFHRLGSSLLP